MARRTITPEWICDVKAALLAQNKSQNWLANEVNSSSATLSLILAGTQQSSKLVEPISDVLNLQLPGLIPIRADAQELIDLTADVSESDMVLLVALARRLAGEEQNPVMSNEVPPPALSKTQTKWIAAGQQLEEEAPVEFRRFLEAAEAQLRAARTLAALEKES